MVRVLTFCSSDPSLIPSSFLIWKKDENELTRGQGWPIFKKGYLYTVFVRHRDSNPLPFDLIFSRKLLFPDFELARISRHFRFPGRRRRVRPERQRLVVRREREHRVGPPIRAPEIGIGHRARYPEVVVFFRLVTFLTCRYFP